MDSLSSILIDYCSKSIYKHTRCHSSPKDSCTDELDSFTILKTKLPYHSQGTFTCHAACLLDNACLISWQLLAFPGKAFCGAGHSQVRQPWRCIIDQQMLAESALCWYIEKLFVLNYNYGTLQQSKGKRHLKQGWCTLDAEFNGNVQLANEVERLENQVQENSKTRATLKQELEENERGKEESVSVLHQVEATQACIIQLSPHSWQDFLMYHSFKNVKWKKQDEKACMMTCSSNVLRPIILTFLDSGMRCTIVNHCWLVQDQRMVKMEQKRALEAEVERQQSILAGFADNDPERYEHICMAL